MSKGKKVRMAVVISVVAGFSMFIAFGLYTAHREIQKEVEAQQALRAKLDSDPITVSGLYNALNKQRASSGVGPLGTVLNLETAATQYCNDMIASKYFDYKNPTSGKDANSFITDNTGDLYYKTYVSSIMQGDATASTATDVIDEAIKVQATNLNNPNFNSIGWAVCNSPDNENLKYAVAALAEKADKPAPQPAPVYNNYYQQPSYTPRTSIYCSSTSSPYSYSVNTYCY